MSHKEKIFKAYLLKLLTRKKRTHLDLTKAKRVLILKYDRIGDMVVTTPLFRELKSAFPNIQISVLASQTNKNVIKYNPYISSVFTTNKDNIFGDLIMLFRLRKKQFDVCIELEHSVVYHALIRLKILNPKTVVSIHKDGRYGVSGSDLELYEHHSKLNITDNFGQIWLDTLTFFGISPNSKKYDFFLSGLERSNAKKFIRYAGDKFKIGINIEGSFKEKRIQLTELKRICAGIYEHFKNIEIIILALPGQECEIDGLVGSLKLNFVRPSYFSILDVAALIEQLDLVITPDTSIVHIASAFDKPVVSIHENNPDSYRLWKPTSALNRTVFAKSKHGLHDYSVDDVVRFSVEILDMLGKKQH